MSTSAEVKKKIAGAWIKKFPQLRIFSANRFFKIIGPFVAGIELVNLRGAGDYGPHFVLYPLWKDNVEDCLDRPVIHNAFKTPYGSFLTLRYDSHDDFTLQQVEDSPAQILLPLSGDVSLNQLFAAIDIYAAQPAVKAQNPHMRAMLLMSLFHAALYTGNKNKIEQVFTTIEQESPRWNRQNFNHWFGDLDEWIGKLREQKKNRKEFLSMIDKNKADKKLSQLAFSGLED